MSPQIRRRLLTSLLGVLVLGVAVAGQAQAAPTGENAAAPDVGVNDVSFCNGGPQEAALTALNNSPTTIGENGAFVPLPGAVVPFQVPMGDSDQILVTFSAEAILGGQTTPLTVPTDHMALVVLLDGAPLPPLDDLIFTTDAGHANAIEGCRRVGPGNHVVTVQWLLVDQGAASMLTGTLDDWTLHVEVND